MRRFCGRLIISLITAMNVIATGLEVQGQDDDLFSSVRASTVFSDDLVSTGQTTAVTPWVEPSTAGSSPTPLDSGSSASDVSLGTLQGRWAASRSATEAFAMQLNADATFVLVSVINRRQARSTGKFTLQNGQLTLEDSNGIRIVGIVRLRSASEFQFEQQTAGKPGDALSFRKAP